MVTGPKTRKGVLLLELKQTQAFIEALLEWKASDPKVQDYNTLLFLLAFRLGLRDYRSPSEEIVQRRIEELIEEHGIHEDLLVMGLVQDITTHLHRAVTKHGDHIILNEATKERIPDSDMIDEMLEKLKAPGYNMRAQQDLDSWLIVVAMKFNTSNRERWELDRTLEMHDRFRSVTSQIPQEVREVFSGVPLGKLRDRISINEMKNLTLDEAVQLRTEIMGE